MPGALLVLVLLEVLEVLERVLVLFVLVLVRVHASHPLHWHESCTLSPHP
jgi:hypothetical protein